MTRDTPKRARLRTEASLLSLMLVLAPLLRASAEVTRDGSLDRPGQPGPRDVPGGYDSNGSYANYLISDELGAKTGRTARGFAAYADRRYGDPDL